MDVIRPWLHLVVTNAWIQKWDRYLLSQRSLDDPYKPWFWHLVWGKLEYLEWYGSLQENIQKEIQEEVGLEVQHDMQILGNLMTTTKSTVLYITFLCKRKSWEALALEDTEAVRRVSEEDLQHFSEPNIFAEFLPYIL